MMQRINTATALTRNRSNVQRLNCSHLVSGRSGRSLVFLFLVSELFCGARILAQEADCGGGSSCPTGCPPWCQPEVYTGTSCSASCTTCPPEECCDSGTGCETCTPPQECCDSGCKTCPPNDCCPSCCGESCTELCKELPEPCCQNPDDCTQFVPTCDPGPCDENETPRALTDLSTEGLAFRYEGTNALGLYLDDTCEPTFQSNTIPTEHKNDGMLQASRIQPLDADGNVDRVNGKIGFVSAGFSNPSLKYGRFINDYIAVASPDGRINTKIVCVNGAQGLKALCDWDSYEADNDENAWNVLLDQDTENSLTQGKQVGQTSGVTAVTPLQVQVMFVELVHPNPHLFFCNTNCQGCPECGVCAPGLCGADECKFLNWVYNANDGEVARIKLFLQVAQAQFPNLRQVYFSSRAYGGYANGSSDECSNQVGPPCCGTGGTEPYAYTNGFSIQEVVRLQLTGQLPFAANNLYPYPFVLWGPYWWANGQIANPPDTYPFTTGLNGLTWNCWEYCADGPHPSKDEDVCGQTGLVISGATKAATMLFDFWFNDELAKQWFTPRPAIAVSDPPNGNVDHLQDFKRVSGQLVQQGVNQVVITFNAPVRKVGGGSVDGCLECFDVTSTCQSLYGPCPHDDMPAIQSVAAGPSTNQVTVTLTRQIVPGHWITVRAIVERSDAPHNPIRLDPLDRVDLGFIPGDADGNRVTNLADLARIEEVIEGGGSGFNPALHDQNRDGHLSVADRQREIQLLNGTDTTQPWVNVALPARP